MNWKLRLGARTLAVTVLLFSLVAAMVVLAAAWRWLLRFEVGSDG